jgi:hypothetical protein
MRQRVSLADSDAVDPIEKRQAGDCDKSIITQCKDGFRSPCRGDRMTTHDFSEFSWDEQEDVKAVLANRGLDPRDFQIADNDNVSAGATNGTIRQVSVTRLSTGKRAIYDTDHFATWLTDFAEALEAGDFDD